MNLILVISVIFLVIPTLQADQVSVELDKFISKELKAVEQDKALAMGGINGGRFQGSKWKNKWYKIDNKVENFFRVLTYEPIEPIPGRNTNHYHYSELIVEEFKPNQFRLVKSIKRKPYREGRIDGVPDQSTILKSFSKKGVKFLILEDGGSCFGGSVENTYSLVNDKWQFLSKKLKKDASDCD